MNCLHLWTTVRRFAHWDEYRTCLSCLEDIPKITREK